MDTSLWQITWKIWLFQLDQFSARRAVVTDDVIYLFFRVFDRCDCIFLSAAYMKTVVSAW